MWFGKRGLVAKISGGYCIILTSKGTYEKIPMPAQGARVGAEVSYPAVIPSHVRPMMLVASLLILFVCLSLIGQVSPPVAMAYISLDINPSLELSVDKNLRVIDAKPFNDDAANLLKQENLRGKSLYDALAAVVNRAIAQNYIKAGQDNLIVSTVTPSGTGTASIDQRSIQQFLDKTISTGKLTAEVKTYSATPEFRAEAEDKGLSPGKYLVYEQLIGTGNQVSIADVQKNTIRKLVNTYKINLLPNYQKIRIQKRSNGQEPEITVDENGKTIPVADLSRHSSTQDNVDNGHPVRQQKAAADNGHGARPKTVVPNIRPNTRQDRDNKKGQNNVRQTDEVTNNRRAPRSKPIAPIPADRPEKDSRFRFYQRP